SPRRSSRRRAGLALTRRLRCRRGVASRVILYAPMVAVFRHGSWARVILLGVVIASGACKPVTRDNPDVCNPDAAAHDECAPPRMCDPQTFHCVFSDAGAGGIGGGGGTGGQAMIGGAGGGGSSGAGGQDG